MQMASEKLKYLCLDQFDIPNKKLLPAYNENDHSSVACFAIFE